MEFNKENLKWYSTTVGTLNINICDLNNGGKIIIVRDPKILALDIRSKFWVSSYDKAQGVPHLMEHCLFSNVIDGKSIFKCQDELTRLGITLNAQTSYKDITLVANTASCMSVDKYPDDNIYSLLCSNYEYKILLKRLGDIHYNLVTTDVSSEYLEQEKGVIYGEMQNRYPGDAQSIRKIAEWSTLTGTKYSTIGNEFYLKNMTTDYINYMRLRTFLFENIKTIVISAPEFVDIDDILDIYVARLWEGLDINYKTINKDINKFSKEAIEFVDTYASPRFEPDQNSFLVRSIQAKYDNEHEESSYIYKVKSEKNSAIIKDVIINLPTIKINLDMLIENTAKTIAQLYIQSKLNEYYREKHPVTYGVSRYHNIWRYDRENYNTTSFIIELSADASSEKFMDSLFEFKKWVYNSEEVDNTIRSWDVTCKNEWYSFMNGEINQMNPLDSFDDINSIVLGTLTETAEDKINMLNQYSVEKNKLFPKALVDKFNYIINNKELIHKYVKTYIANWKVNIFDSTNLIEEDKDNKEF